MRALVVGIGNPLRRDDGIGQAVIDTLGHAASDVDVCAVHCLLPELAGVLGAYTQVIFVDASDAEGIRTVQVQRVATRLGRGVAGHTCGPADVLGLAALLGHPLPQAWLVTIPASDVGFGPGLSATTSAHLPQAVRAVAALLNCRVAGVSAATTGGCVPP